MPAPTSNLVSQNKSPFGSLLSPVKSGFSTSYPAVGPLGTTGTGKSSTDLGLSNLTGKNTLNMEMNTSTHPISPGGLLGIGSNSPAQQVINNSLAGNMFGPVASPQTNPTNITPTVNTATQTATQPNNQPVAQASYSGGQALPAVGSATYNQAQSLYSQANQPSTNTSNQSTAPASTGTPGIFSQVMGNLSGTQPSQPVTDAYGNLSTTSAGNIPLGQNAINIANTAGQNIANIGIAGAKGEAGYNTTGTSPVGEGNAAVLAQTTAAQQQAVAQGADAQLAGNAQALTAQNQAQSGYGQAGQLANTAQGNQITAQNNAGNLASPRQNGYVLIDPSTGQPVGGAGGATGAAFQGGQIGAAETAGGNTFALNQANTAAKGIQGTIQQYIAANPNLNASSSTIANAAQQWIQGKQLGDPAYQNLFNYINEYISTLAPILGVGGDTTNLKTQIAQSFINSQASGQSISQVLNGIGQLADQKLQNLVSAGQGGGQVAGGVPQGGTPTSFGTSW